MELRALQLWFVAFVAVVSAERDSGERAASNTVDDVSENMHVELLQRDIKLSHREAKLEQATDTVTVNKWGCKAEELNKETNVAYQSTTTDDNSWTKFKVMHLNNGSYGEVVDVNLEKFSSKKGEGLIRSMNSCAINPIDEILYCSMEIYGKGSFLVAIDKDNNMGFVNKLIGFRYAADFIGDNYYVSGQKGFSVIKGVSNKTKYATFQKLHEGLKGRHEGEIRQSLYLVDEKRNDMDFELGQDYAEWDGKLATLKNQDLLLVDVSGPEFTVEKFATNVKTGPGGIRVWGAAWNFQGAVYFAADDGEGFWSLEGIDYKNKKATFERKGKANEIDWNDGFTCRNLTMGKKSDPSPCKHDFYQVTTYGSMSHPARDTGSKTVIRHLDPKSGKFTEDFTVPRDNFKGMKSLNACAVNPKDKKLYCHIWHASYLAIATIDKAGPSLITKFDTDGRNKICFAAVFDSKGTYWFWCGPGGQGGNTLYSIADLNKVEKGADSIHDINVHKRMENIKSHCCEYTADKVGADFVTKVVGEKTYLISIVESATNDVSVIDITDSSNPGKPDIYKPDGLPPPEKGDKPNIWGSAWTAPAKGDYAGKVFFARDADPKKKENVGKLYEMTELDTTGKTAKFKEAGNAANAAWHDGFACQEKITGIDER